MARIESVMDPVQIEKCKYIHSPSSHAYEKLVLKGEINNSRGKLGALGGMRFKTKTKHFLLNQN